MKLKYYLRGLGVGIVVTVLLSSIAHSMMDKDMTTEQIIQKAIDLGMVKKDDYDVVNADLSVAKKNVEDLQKQLDDTNNKLNEKEKQENSNPPNSNESLQYDKSKVEEKNETIPTTQTTTVSFTISQGMSAEAVSKLLKEKGIISDADEFNQYIVDNGNVNNLQVGEYELNASENYQTIMNKLTGH